MLNAVLGFFAGLLSGFFPGFYITNLLPLNVSFEFIICSSVAFLFASIFPAVLLCAPSSENYLATLPAFEFLKQGRALKSVDISLVSSLSAVIVFIFLALFAVVFLFPVYPFLKYVTSALLILSLIILCKRWQHLLIALMSALLGFLLMNYNVLTPMLSGFFGLSTLIISLKITIPSQIISKYDINRFNIIRTSIFSGFLSFFFAFIPAISATILAFLSNIFGKFSREEFMAFTVATNVYYMLLSFVGIFIIHRARSGPAYFLMQTHGDIAYLVVLSVLSAIFAFFILNKVKVFLILFFQKYRLKILIFSAIFLFIFTFIFYSFLGLAVLVAAALISLLAYKLNVNKSVCMASIIVPTLILIL